VRQVVLVLAIRNGRREALDVSIELVADFSEADESDAVVLEDHQDDGRTDRVEDEPALVLAFAGLLGFGCGCCSSK
jgi:hypothetical protein